MHGDFIVASFKTLNGFFAGWKVLALQERRTEELQQALLKLRYVPVSAIKDCCEQAKISRRMLDEDCKEKWKLAGEALAYAQQAQQDMQVMWRDTRTESFV